MSPTTRYIKKHAKAAKRRRRQAQERHEQQQRQAQRDIDALYQALHDVGLPDDFGLRHPCDALAAGLVTSAPD